MFAMAMFIWDNVSRITNSIVCLRCYAGKLKLLGMLLGARLQLISLKIQRIYFGILLISDN